MNRIRLCNSINLLTLIFSANIKSAYFAFVEIPEPRSHFVELLPRSHHSVVEHFLFLILFLLNF